MYESAQLIKSMISKVYSRLSCCFCMMNAKAPPKGTNRRILRMKSRGLEFPQIKAFVLPLRGLMPGLVKSKLKGNRVQARINRALAVNRVILNVIFM